MSDAVKVLLTGVNGLVGPYVLAAFQGRGWQVDATSRSSGIHCDLSDLEAVTAIGPHRYDAVVNLAALTDVDRCESDMNAAMVSNCRVIENLVQRISTGAHFVQVSTDQVYPGVGGPHREAGVGPVNCYGVSKLAGERAALVHDTTTVLRTNLFGPSLTRGRLSLSDWIIQRLAGGDDVPGFADILFTPLHMATLAGRIAEVVAGRITGVYNLGSRAGMSKYDFAVLVARRVGFNPDRVLVASSSTVGGRAPRPADMRMDSAAFEAATSSNLPTLAEEIALL